MRRLQPRRAADCTRDMFCRSLGGCRASGVGGVGARLNPAFARPRGRLGAGALPSFEA